MELNAEQRLALEAVQAGQNIFLTGPAGTGKSFVVAKIKEWAAAADRDAALTASTGTAAVLIGGRTLHSWAGVGLGTGTVSELLHGFMSGAAKKRVNLACMLLIDEISMINAEFFDKLDAYLGHMRHKVDRPFGGLQLIVIGDFAQLEPVSGGYAFQSQAWRRANFLQVQLTEQMRQADGPDFTAMLSRMRFGNCLDSDLAMLKATRSHRFPAHIVPTKIFPLNVDVDRINSAAFKALIAAGAQRLVYPVLGRASGLKWAKGLKIQDLELCMGAQVMSTQNIAALDVVNGSRGQVIGLSPQSVQVDMVDGRIVEFDRQTMVNEDDRKQTFSFIPLRLAFAVSGHKCQGMTLDAVEMDLSRVFAAGQAYVMLSRARSLSAVRILNVRASAFQCHPAVQDMYGVRN